MFVYFIIMKNSARNKLRGFIIQSTRNSFSNSRLKASHTSKGLHQPVSKMAQTADGADPVVWFMGMIAFGASLAGTVIKYDYVSALSPKWQN